MKTRPGAVFVRTNALLALFFTGVSHAQRVPAHETEAERVRDVARLERVYAQMPGFETRLIITTLTSLPISDASEWDHDDWRERRLVDWQSVDRNHRLETWLTDPNTRTLDTSTPPHIIATWNGSEWRKALMRRKTLVISDDWVNTPEHQFLPLFNVCEGPSPVRPFSLVGLLKRGEIDSVHEEGTRVTYSLVMHEAPGLSLLLEFDREPKIHVRSLRMKLHSPNPVTGEAELRADVHYVVTEWGKYGAVMIPMKATRDTKAYPEMSPTAPIRQPFRNRIVIERSSWRQLLLEGVDTTAFEVSPKEGWTVDDLTSRTTFKVGDNEIVIDGYRFLTHDSLTLASIQELPTVVDAARPLQFTRRVEYPAFRPDVGERWVRGLVFGLAAFAIVLLFLLYPLTRRCR